jgi:hypothetical protein
MIRPFWGLEFERHVQISEYVMQIFYDIFSIWARGTCKGNAKCVIP